MNILLKLDNITISYDRHPALHHVNAEFESGSLTAITGINGAGKSTLLKAIARIKKIDSGKITLNCDRKKIAYLPQITEIQRDFPISVFQLMTSGFFHETNFFSSIKSNLKEKILQALKEVGLENFENREISSLSLGQFQKVLFARILIQNADLILLDEPFSMLDQETEKHLLEIILRLHKEKRTIICISHNFEQIKKYFPKCLLLARKVIAYGDSEQILNPQNLAKINFTYEEFDKNEICKEDKKL